MKSKKKSKEEELPPMPAWEVPDNAASMLITVKVRCKYRHCLGMDITFMGVGIKDSFPMKGELCRTYCQCRRYISIDADGSINLNEEDADKLTRET